MDELKDLQQFHEAIGQCVRCGACQAHCPVYDQTRHEGGVARGKLAIAKALLDGHLAIDDPRLGEDISLCLMCGSCVVKCPNSVPTEKIVGAIRKARHRSKGTTLMGKAVSAVTGSPPLLKNLTRAATALSPALFKKVPGSSGLHLRFPFTGEQKRTFPAIAPRSLFERIPEYTQGNSDKPVIGLFAGCAITYLYPEIGMAMHRLLRLLGFSIFFPHNQGCCGIPARSVGDGDLIQRLTQNNIQAFATRDVTHIVTACATCNSGLSAGLEESSSPDHIKITDIHRFLYDNGYMELLKSHSGKPLNIRVTYHDPCHLRLKGITAEPRALLQAIPGVEFLEMENAATCCGLGGTFSVKHYELSQAIGEKKVHGIANSKADYVATGCPGCMIQLQDSITRAKLNTKVVHVLDLLTQAVTDDQTPSQE